MAQMLQTTPTVQANIGGTNTAVNLRDWLNTRLGPFLKKAIIESLDSEAQYPLQWLGEQLILQSIEFEGNPDTTNIRERFVYKHEINSRAAPPEPAVAAPPAEVITAQQHQVSVDQVATSGAETAQSDAIPALTDTIQTTRTEVEPTEQVQSENAIEVNGTAVHVGTEAPSQDTEMSNAP